MKPQATWPQASCRPKSTPRSSKQQPKNLPIPFSFFTIPRRGSGLAACKCGRLIWNETVFGRQASLSEFDDVIKKTLAKASPHSRKVFSQSPLTGEELLDLANGSGLRVAATTKPNGRPTSITDVIVADGKLYIGVDPATARYTNLKHNTSITVTMAEGWKRQAILEGEARFLDMKSPLAEEVLDAQKKRYGWASEVLAEIVPSRIFTWKAPPRNQ